MLTSPWLNNYYLIVYYVETGSGRFSVKMAPKLRISHKNELKTQILQWNSRKMYYKKVDLNFIITKHVQWCENTVELLKKLFTTWEWLALCFIIKQETLTDVIKK